MKESRAVPDIALNKAARPVLPEDQVARRVALLVELQAAFSALGIQSVLARSRRLVLRSAGTGLEPSGPTDPQLHVFAEGGGPAFVATTDGAAYRLADGRVYPADDPSAVAVAIQLARRHLVALE